jgi:hypothetical protein
MQKLMKKDSFLATDATTQSSNQEENEAKYIFLFNCTITQQGKMLTSTKPRERKITLWLKAQIAKESEQRCKKTIKTTPILTLV